MDGKYVVLYAPHGSGFKQVATEFDSEEAALDNIKNFREPNRGKYDAPTAINFRVARLIAAVTTKPVIETVVTRY